MLFRDYSYELTHLKVTPGLDGIPHKPVLLLSIMDCIENGFINSPKIRMTDNLINVFNHNWQKWVSTPHKKNLLLPLFHMQNEGFWTLIPKEGKKIPGSAVKTLKQLMDCMDYVLLNEDLFYCFSDPGERMRLRILVLKRYFYDTPDGHNRFMIGIKSMEQEMLSDPIDVYHKKMEKIEELKRSHDTNTYIVERIIRKTVFEELTKRIYDYQCCMSGLQVKTEDVGSMLDACHIIPYPNSLDDTIGNGIPLCPTLHRAFDNGLITIDESNYKVIVSKHFDENENSIYSFKQLEGRKIILPEEENYYPLRENLLWHRENVFRG